MSEVPQKNSSYTKESFLKVKKGRLAATATSLIALAAIFLSTGIFSPVNAKFAAWEQSIFLTPPIITQAPSGNQQVPSTFTVPITVSDTTGDAINRYQFALTYDPNVLTFAGCSTINTIASFMNPVCSVSPAGTLNVFTNNGTANTLTGSGSILDVTFTTAPSAVIGSASSLNFAPGTLRYFKATLEEVPGVPIGGQINLVGPTFDLTVVKPGNGSGTVISNTPGINCGLDCTESYPPGSTVTLSAFTNPGSTFTGWLGGGCSGTGTCTVTVNSAVSVGAVFTLQTFVLDVTKSGSGSGTITSFPAGINCGVDCTENYNSGTFVQLTATPNAFSTFTGWSGGGCSGTSVCNVSVTAATTVNANFTAPTFALNVVKTGFAANFAAVVSSPAGIDCGLDCSETYGAGTVVTLTAVPESGIAFTGWTGGGCTGTTAPCMVTVLEATTVSANFVLETFRLDVLKTGNGAGTVTSLLPGINCGADCTETYNPGTVVTLTAAPSVGSTFTGWSGGGCSGTGTCTLIMNTAASVTANFNLQAGGPSPTPTPTPTPTPGAATEGDIVGNNGETTGGGGIQANDVTIISQTVIGQYTLTGSQFQRADVNSPCGNGTIDPGDVTVISQWALGMNLPAPAACGPAAVAASEETSRPEDSEGTGRVIRAVNTTAVAGGTVTVSFVIVSQGNEASASYTVTFPQATLSNPQVAAGSGVPSGTTVLTNPSQVAQGRIGILIATPNAYAAGTRQMLTITFNVSAAATAGTYPIGFTNTPVGQNVSAAAVGALLPATYETGNVLIGATAAGVEVSGKVTTPDGRGLRNAVVSIVDDKGVERTAITSSFGFYKFEDIEIGETYVIGVRSRRYRFDQRILQVFDNLSDFDFVGKE